MAGIAHVGVGLAAKRVAPRLPLWILLVAAWAIDIIWAVFFFAGIEHLPGPEVSSTNPYSHGLLMAVIWSALAGLIAGRLSREPRTGAILGLLVFSHWVVDAISHPMTAAFPEDTGLSLLFEGSPTVGLGLWSTDLGVSVGEYGTLLLGIAIYLLTLRRLRRERRPAARS